MKHFWIIINLIVLINKYLLNKLIKFIGIGDRARSQIPILDISKNIN